MSDKQDLRGRLALVSAQLSVAEISPHEAVLLARDLVTEDAAGEATFELAGWSPAGLPREHLEVLLRRMLAEWGIEAPGPERSAEIVARDLCRRLRDGSLPPETAAHRLLGVLAQGADRARTDRLLRLLDRLEDDLAGRADEAFRADLDALAGELLDQADDPADGGAAK